MQRQEITNRIEENNYTTVAVQAPAGLRQEAMDLATELKRDREVVVISEPCFGACDLAQREVDAMDCDCLVQLGHNPFLEEQLTDPPEIPVLFWDYQIESELITPAQVEKIEEATIGLVATVQHLPDLAETRQRLETGNKQVKMGEKATKTGVKGQVLGCDVSAGAQVAEKVDAFLLLASGNFHATALQQLGNKVYVFNPLTADLKELTGENDSKKRREMAKALKYKEEKRWGILAASKSGQFHPNMIETVKEKLEGLGKEPYVFIGNRILEQDLQGFGLNIFVNTACPRLTEDFEDITVVNPSALEALD